MESMKIDQSLLSAGPHRDLRLDLIKAISICFVFVWHVNPLRPEHVIAKQVVSFLMASVSLVAVPSFITVALILFYKKYNTAGAGYLKKRIARLSSVFAFWLIIQNIIYILIYRQLPPVTFYLIFIGGPGIPIAGASVFYFLSDLIILTYAFYLFLMLSDKAKARLSVIIVILTFAYFIASSTIGFRLPGQLGFGPYNYLLSFIIYIPLSYYLANNIEALVKYRYVFLFLYLASVSYERIMRVVFDLKLFAPYSRTSVFFGVLVLFALAFNCKVKKHSGFIVLSKYSLGIFAVHNYFKILSYRIYDHINLKWLHYDSNVTVQYPITFILTLILTFAFIYLMKNFWTRKFMT